MEPNDQKKLRQVCLRIAFLMPHQEVLPDLKEFVAELEPSDEYLKGAQDALNYLVSFLEQKGNR